MANDVVRSDGTRPSLRARFGARIRHPLSRRRRAEALRSAYAQRGADVSTHGKPGGPRPPVSGAEPRRGKGGEPPSGRGGEPPRGRGGERPSGRGGEPPRERGGAPVRQYDERPGPGDVDAPLPPREVLLRYGARVLDPAVADRLPDEPPPPPGLLTTRQTVYLPGSLIATTLPQRGRELLDEAADALQLALRYDNEGSPGVRGEYTATRITLAPRRGESGVPDAWALLQKARARALLTEELDVLGGVSLDHLISATVELISTPLDSPHPVRPSADPGSAVAQYAMPGWGGRQPVQWLGPDLERLRDPVLSTRPVVAVLDTGCGEHAWLPETIVTREITLDGNPIGLGDGGYETIADRTGPMDGEMDRVAGHGTFICGLVRQQCPDADLVSVKLIESDGALTEEQLVRALEQLCELVRRHVDDPNRGRRIDVLSLSLGYYYETPDEVFSPHIFTLIQELGRLGVVVIASAGNNATRRPMFPAAFTPYPGGKVERPSHDSLPVLSVGALNPDDSVALFSNSERWVLDWEPGAALISTFPRFDSGGNPAVSIDDPSGQPRRSLDPDGYSGWAAWSGTSFAAPVLAGRIACALLDEAGEAPTLDRIGSAEAVDRGWHAIESLTTLERPAP